MRLICPNCATQYEVDASAIPPQGRDVQCGTCNTTWFQPPEGSDEDHPDAAGPGVSNRPPVSADADAPGAAAPELEEAPAETAPADPPVEPAMSPVEPEVMAAVEDAAIADWALAAAADALGADAPEQPVPVPSLADLASELSAEAGASPDAEGAGETSEVTPEELPPAFDDATLDAAFSGLAPPPEDPPEPEPGPSEDPFPEPDPDDSRFFPEEDEGPDTMADNVAVPEQRADPIDDDNDLSVPFTEPASVSDFRPDPEGVLARRLKERVARAAMERSEEASAPADPILAATTAAVAAAASQAVAPLPADPEPASPRTARPRRMDDIRPRPKLMAPATPEPKGGGFTRGLVLVVVVFAALLSVYLMHARIAQMLPALAPYLEVYAGAVDGVRLWVQSLIGGAPRNGT